MLRSFDCWIESFTPPFSTAFLQLFTSKPVVGLTHLLAAKNMSDRYGIPFDKIESLGLRSYRYFIALTEQARRKVIAQNMGASVVVIPNGVNVSAASAPGSTRSHILYMGRIDVEQKGLDLLLEAISTARSEIHDKVYIAGSGPDESVDYLVDRIANLGLNEMVEYVGRVAGQEKEDLFQKAKFLVMPSRYETLPLTLLEGFAHRCPVVMFDIDDLRWVPESCAVRVEPFSGGEFGRAMAELSRNSGKLGVMQGHAELFSRGFSWDAIAERYIKFLRQVGV
jgi:glycosyltransferase involved in cell wall biosynthesis